MEEHGNKRHETPCKRHGNNHGTKENGGEKIRGDRFSPFFRGINGIMGLHEGFESDNMGKTMGKTMGKMMGFYHHLMGLN